MKKPKNQEAQKPKPPDIHAIMGHFCRGLALVIAAHRRLDADDAETAASEECAVLEEGIAKLKELYNELDAADIQLGKFLGQ
jgi:hypothetical protein